MPILALAVVLGSLAGYYFYEQSVTKSALQSFHQGEELALKAKYQKAQELFQTTLDKRSNFHAARLNIKISQIASEIHKKINAAEKARKNGKFDQSLHNIDAAEDKLANYQGPLIDQLQKSISDIRVTTKVAQLRHEMKGKTSIDELEPILDRAQSLETPEAKEIVEIVRSQIVKLAFKKANDRLQNHKFSDALAAVTAGLQYDGDNEKLISLKKSIKEQKKNFEQAQQRRIEQALAAAAEEREHNRHNAIKLVGISSHYNQFGDLIVSGSIKNVATVPISLISVSYNLYDRQGQLQETNKTYVSPNKLYPEQIGYFEYTHFFTEEKMRVKVTGFTWYIR